ncbi:relaxase/mobilization nuclease domain-containing protein [Ruminococcaceae bacterium OttesenSCG-928-L11]|nr:relaxase/mobilization nuclease domain-containing protein [Ruminococcaceae bacterium OttesenSCG-928-L11]
MATTKIWPIRDNLKRVVDYAANPDKTESQDLMQTLHYAANTIKTSEQERAYFVTGINCHAENAYKQMHTVKAHFGKTGGNVAYHCYQSFAPGEVTPEQCHEIGVQLAQQLWGDRYQVLVTTHLDRNHLHNHLVINSVSFVDGKKFNDNYRAYYAMREASDALCQAHGLSVIKNPNGKTPRSIYFAEKNGEPTRYNLMREAIDRAASMSFTMTQFAAALKKQGYVLEINPKRKYPTIRALNSKKPVRLYHLGENYLPDKIKERILHNTARERQQYHHFMNPTLKTLPKRMQYKGSYSAVRKMSGLRALYLYYCYRLGAIPKNNPQKPLSPEMREACRRLKRYAKQVRLVCKHKLDTDVDVQGFVGKTEHNIQSIIVLRNGIYNKLRRCREPDEILSLKQQRGQYTAELSALRKDKRVAETVLADIGGIREQLRAEHQMQRSEHAPRQNAERRYAR